MVEIEGVDMRGIRQHSLQTANQLGYSINWDLPLLNLSTLREQNEVFNRMLCMQVLGACAYGFRGIRALDWLQHENAAPSLTSQETAFLIARDGDPNVHASRIEGVWALAWVLSVVDVFDYSEGCDEQFAALLPDPRLNGSSNALRKQTCLRSVVHVLQNLDTAYCLHWAIRDAEVRGAPLPGKVEPYVIVERRRALEWCVSKDDWDEVSLDT